MAPTTKPWRRVRRGGLASAVLALAIVAPSATAQADEFRDLQWYLGSLDMEAAWDVTEGAGTTVAVLDTGVDSSHPDFGDAVVPGTDLTGGGGDGTDAREPHGTSMAGLIGARGRGPDGIRGIAPATTILPVTIDSGATMAEGFRWATDHDADVINLSGGTEFRDDPLVRDAVAYALSRDVVVVASAGNGGGPGVDFPGGYGGVITVSALTKQDTLTGLSSYGPEVDLAAPGDGVVSLLPNSRYGETSGGTSSAAAIVSGVAALVRAQFPELDAANVVNRLIATGRDIGAAGLDDEFGYGVVDPVAALTADVPAVSENPLGSPDGGGAEPTETVTEPPTSEQPGSTPTVAGADPCATGPAPGPADTGAPAGPAGALTLGEGCDEPGLAGASSAGSNDALGVVVGVGIAAVVLLGAAVFLLRRHRSRAAPPVPAAGTPVLPGAAPPGGGGWPPPTSGPPPGR